MENSVSGVIDFNKIPYMTKEEVNAVALRYVNESGEFGYVYNLRQFMSTEGIDAAVMAYLNIEDSDPGIVSAMLSFTSGDVTEYVIETYPKTYGSNFLRQPKEKANSGAWSLIRPRFPRLNQVPWDRPTPTA